MPQRRPALSWVARGVLAGTAALFAAAPAGAGPVPFDTYLQFSFDGAGSSAAGCFPDDPGGSFCLASSGTPTGFADAPAWTFSGAAALTVVDAFESGDRFDIFDFGVLVGSTSAPLLGVDCGDDPVVCLGTAGISSGVFALGAGLHSMTIVASEALGLGSAYFQIAAVQAVPEPASLALVAAALLGSAAARRGGARRPA
jgi:hypothetical protein